MDWIGGDLFGILRGKSLPNLPALPKCRRIGLALAICVMVFYTATGCALLKSDKSPVYQTLADDGKGDQETAAELEEQAIRQIKKGNLDKAQETLQRALAASVSYGPAHNTLGTVFYKKHQLYLAAWEFQYAAKLMPNRYEPYNNLGLTFENAERLEEAIAWYSKAWDVAPQNPEVLGNLARAKMKRGDRDDSVAMLLNELILYDNRANWIEWAEFHLIRLRNRPSIASTDISDPPLTESKGE